MERKTAKEIVHDYQSGGVEPKEVFISEEELSNSLSLIKTCCSSIKTHLRRKNTIQYDWEYDIKQALDEIETEVSSWQK